MKLARQIKVIGKVQGVYFRAFTQKEANELGVVGTVKNEADGSVLIYAEAEKEIMEKFIRWCHTGSPNAQVDEVWVNTIPLNNFQSFDILR